MTARQSGPLYDEIVAANEDASKRKVGLWCAEPKFIEKHTRTVKYQGETDYSAAKLLNQSMEVTTPLAAILEYVFSASYVNVYVYKLQAVIKLQLIHLYSPNAKEEPELAEQGKVLI